MLLALSLQIKRAMQNYGHYTTDHFTEQHRFVSSQSESDTYQTSDPEGRKENFKQEFLAEKSKDVQRLNPASLPYQLNLQLEMAQALKKKIHVFASVDEYS